MNELATASIEVDIDGQQYAANGEGNGGFDAFTAALNDTLKQKGMMLPELLDYTVHIPRGGLSSALTEASISWSIKGSKKMTTRGVHANQVYAAIEATLKMVNRLLHHE